MNRRECLKAGAALLAGSVSLSGSARAADTPAWKIGVFNRVWGAFGLEDALKGAREAGFSRIGLISPHRGKHLTSGGVDAKTLDAMKRQIGDAGLELVVTSIRLREADPLPALRDDVLQQVENGARLGAKYVMTFGVDRPEHFPTFEKMMTEVAPRAESLGIKLVVKPHGGITSGAEETLQFLDRVGHPNVSVWYDAGNIIHYTGGDPIVAYLPLAKRVSGFCVKDCARKGGEVMIPLGSGKVDFVGLFTKMAAAGFDGPALIEGLPAGPTPEATTANARVGREALEKAMAAAGVKPA
ncbi:MAG: sugar phosphate isomerase/epimerase [Isosphaeraceae bacterium]